MSLHVYQQTFRDLTLACEIHGNFQTKGIAYMQQVQLEN